MEEVYGLGKYQVAITTNGEGHIYEVIINTQTGGIVKRYVSSPDEYEEYQYQEPDKD